MKNKSIKLMVITTIICLLPIVLAAVLYNQLPSQIPIHFDVNGTPNNYLPKAVACFVLPLGFAILNIFVQSIYMADPKSKNVSFAVKNLVKWLVPILSVICMPMSLFISMGKNIPIQIIIPCLVGILIIIMGNYLPKSRQNYTVGIRLPWTLSSEDNWNKTHRFAGILWIIGGFTMLFTSLFQFYSMLSTIIIVILLVIIPGIYSYSIYKSEN